jgi:hypothetical protein
LLLFHILRIPHVILRREQDGWEGDPVNGHLPG